LGTLDAQFYNLLLFRVVILFARLRIEPIGIVYCHYLIRNAIVTNVKRKHDCSLRTAIIDQHEFQWWTIHKHRTEVG